MAKTLEFLFDFASPNVWLAYRALPPILERTGATLLMTPALLGGIFKATGNQSPVTAFADVKGKLAYEQRETERFIARHGFSQFRMNPHFPVNTLLLMRGFLVARAQRQAAAYLEAGLAAMWEEGVDCADAGALSARLDRAGLDGAALLARTQDPQVKTRLAYVTERAVERGVFGLPTFFVGDEMFFGKERLGQIEDELARP